MAPHRTRLRDRLKCRSAIRKEVRGLRALRGERNEGQLLRNWIGSITGILALALSGGTAYLSLLRQEDDLRMALSSLSEAYIYFPRTHTSIRGTVYITIINSGNRAASVNSIGLRVSQPGDIAWESAFGRFASSIDCKSNYELEYDAPPFVVAPGEIVVKLIEFRPDRFLALSLSNGVMEIPLSAANKQRATFGGRPHVNLCMVLSVVTPDSAQSEIEIPLSSTELEAEEGYSPTDAIVVPMIQLNRPYPLVQELGSMF